jgi:hypothetical protein
MINECDNGITLNALAAERSNVKLQISPIPLSVIYYVKD